jgi:hypothetical protein
MAAASSQDAAAVFDPLRRLVVVVISGRCICGCASGQEVRVRILNSGSGPGGRPSGKPPLQIFHQTAQVR